LEKKVEIELIIFDMDGLMFDTEKISYIAWNEAAKQYNYQISRDLFEKTVGTDINKTKEIYIKHFGDRFPFDLIRSERAKISDEIIKTNGVPIKKGFCELMNHLNNGKIKKAVATSTSRKRALNLLSLVQIDGFFDYILCGDEIKNCKPNPEIFLKVADKLKCTPKKCLVLEDSEIGIIAAYQAGMIPVMVPDLKEPSKEIQSFIFSRMDSLFDVKSFLEEILK
jgi:HAD superfamily hydrolase (TIGR01509 family)